MNEALWIGDLLARRLPPLLVATTAVLGVALLLDRLLERRVRAGLRLYLYLAVLARAVLPLDGASPIGLFRAAPAGQLIADDGSVTVIASGLARGAPGGGALWLGLGYLAGLVALLGWSGWARLSLGRAVRAAHPLRGTAVTGGVPVLVHPRLGPVLAGLFRPRIVIPAALAGPEHTPALALVLRHEAAHFARRDPWLEAAMQLTCFALWPLVPVWLAAGRARVLVELACDERALAGADGPLRRRYGELLVALAAAEPVAPLAAGLTFGSALRVRVRGLQPFRRWPAFAQVPLVASLVGLALACTATPPPEGAPTGDTGAASAPQPAGGARPGLARPIIDRIVEVKANATRACYREARGRLSDATVRVSVSFTIGGTGAVDAAEVVGAGSGDAAMDRCLVDAVRGMRFPRPLGGVTVRTSYAFEFRATPAPAPPAPPPVATARGEMDKAVIRQTIVSHIAEVKGCYDTALARRPGLGGRVVVQFTIGATGQVVSSALQATTLGDTDVERCMVGAVLGWRFPPPTGGGDIIVSYPFVLTPA
jgi:TonB family protein